MRKQYGFTLIELMIVVAIIGILSAVSLPMYTNNVKKTKTQEAVNTIGAIKDEIANYFSESGWLPPRCRNHRQILNNLGLQVPESGKWKYTIRNNGVIVAEAQVPAGRPGCRGRRNIGWVRCTPQVDGTNGVITHWQWSCDGRGVKRSYLPK